MPPPVIIDIDYCIFFFTHRRVYAAGSVSIVHAGDAMKSGFSKLPFIIIAAGICMILAVMFLPTGGAAQGKDGSSPVFPPEFLGFRFTEDNYPYVVEIRDYDHPIQQDEMASWKNAVIAAYRDRIKPQEFREKAYGESTLKENDIVIAYAYYIDRAGVPHELESVSVKCSTCTGEVQAVTRYMIQWLDTDLRPFITNTTAMHDT
jgi:hypothetical protein